MKKYLLLLIITAFLKAEYREIKFINEDKIIGDFVRDTLLKVIEVDYPPFYKFWRKDPTFKDSNIPKFKTNLLEYSKSLGYYRAKIEANTTNQTIYLNIFKNEPIKINSIKIKEEYREIIKLKRGDIFKTATFSDTKNILNRYFQENGYPKAEVEAKAYVDLDLYQVNLEYIIKKNEKCYFGDTTIKNREKIEKKFIDRQIKYKKDEVFDIKKIEDSYEGLYNYSIFNYILVEPNVDVNSSKLPILISLKEGKNRAFKAFLGFSTDEGPRIGASWEHKNFLGNLKNFKVGAKISGRGYEVYNRFYNPYFYLPLLKEISLENSLKYQDYEYDSYSEKKLEEILTFGKEWIGLEHYFGLMIERSEVNSKMKEYENGSYLINSLFYRVLLDKRDSKMDARSGYLASLYFEKATKSIGSDLEYLKSIAEFRAIKSINDFTFALKSRVGAISTDVPIFKHFFTGGAFTNRGYEYQGLGESDNEGKPYGGITLVDLMLEGRYHITKNFSIATFVDSSMLNNSPYEFSSDFYDSYGFGIRYLTIIGPLRLDIGFPQNDDKNNYRFHFTIGQAF